MDQEAVWEILTRYDHGEGYRIWCEEKRTDQITKYSRRWKIIRDKRLGIHSYTNWSSRSNSSRIWWWNWKRCKINLQVNQELILTILKTVQNISRCKKIPIGIRQQLSKNQNLTTTFWIQTKRQLEKSNGSRNDGTLWQSNLNFGRFIHRKKLIPHKWVYKIKQTGGESVDKFIELSHQKVGDYD